MTTQYSSADLLEVLSKRFQMVKSLADEPVTQAELADRTGVSRPTAHRVIKTLERLDMVRQRGERYELTEFGRAIRKHHEEYLATLDNACRLQALRQELSEDISLDSPILDGGDVTFKDPHLGDFVGYKHRDIFENAVRINSVLDAATVNYFDIHRNGDAHERIVMVVHDALAERLLSSYREPIRDLLETNYFELYRTSESVPYTVTIAETANSTYAFLVCHSEGTPIANVRNDSPEAVAWARDKFQRYYEGATRVTL